MLSEAEDKERSDPKEICKRLRELIEDFTTGVVTFSRTFEPPAQMPLSISVGLNDDYYSFSDHEYSEHAWKLLDACISELESLVKRKLIEHIKRIFEDKFGHRVSVSIEEGNVVSILINNKRFIVQNPEPIRTSEKWINHDFVICETFYNLAENFELKATEYTK